jgi:hypothetical protein
MKNAGVKKTALGARAMLIYAFFFQLFFTTHPPAAQMKLHQFFQDLSCWIFAAHLDTIFTGTGAIRFRCNPKFMTWSLEFIHGAQVHWIS